jgi:fructokinase
MIICLGEALVDLVPTSGASPSDAPHLIVQPGGAPLNVCIALNRLGSEAAFLGTLSSDSFGDRLRELFDVQGISRTPCESVAESTRLAVIDHTNPATPFRFYGDNPADAQLSRGQVEAAFENLKPSGLYVSSLQMTAGGAREAQQYALEFALAAGIPIYCDPNPRPAAWPDLRTLIEATTYLLECASMAKLSLDDAAVLGWPVVPEDLIEWCEARFGCTLFVTGGKAGCWSRVDGRISHAAPPRVEVVDPTGAGDAAFAALVSRFHANRRLTPDDLAFAAAVGAISTQRPGAANGLPTLDEVRIFIASD